MMFSLNFPLVNNDRDSKFIDSIFTPLEEAQQGSRIFIVIFAISYRVVLYRWADPLALNFWASLLL